MRILLLTQVVPYPPDSGPKIKTYYVLRYLAQWHEVHLVSFARSRVEEEHARRLAPLCGSVTTVPLERSRVLDAGHLARSFATGRPFLVERDDSGPMREAIAGLLEQYAFDAVHADQLSMAQFAVDLPVRFRILDQHNAVWTIVQRSAQNGTHGLYRLLAEVEWRKLQAYEGEMCRKFDLVTVVSNDDYLALAEVAMAIFPTKVVPIAVDTQEMAYLPRTSEARDIVSIATMFYPPNAEAVFWFATRVFPLLRQKVPDLRFVIVGSRPPERIASLANDDSGIVVTGYVRDLDPIFRRSALMVVPVRSGSGMRVKILEAFARGIPVVSTSVGIEGIEARAGEHLLVADSPEDFVGAILGLLEDPVEAARLAAAGRELVESRYDWRTALRALDAVYEPAGARQQWFPRAATS